MCGVGTWGGPESRDEAGRDRVRRTGTQLQLQPPVPTRRPFGPGPSVLGRWTVDTHTDTYFPVIYRELPRLIEPPVPPPTTTTSDTLFPRLRLPGETGACLLVCLL